MLIVLQSLEVFEGGYGGDYFLKFIPNSWIPGIILIVAIALVIISSRTSSQDSVVSHLAKAFGGGRE